MEAEGGRCNWDFLTHFFTISCDSVSQQKVKGKKKTKQNTKCIFKIKFKNISNKKRISFTYLLDEDYQGRFK